MNPYDGIPPFGFTGRLVYLRGSLGLGALAR
jgi:hypothetical protein